MSVAPRSPRRTGARCQLPAPVRSGSGTSSGTFRRADLPPGRGAAPPRSGARAASGAVVIPFPVSRRAHVPQPRRGGVPPSGAGPVARRVAGSPPRRVGAGARAGSAPVLAARPGRLRLTRRGRAAVWLLAVTVVALLAVLL